MPIDALRVRASAKERVNLSTGGESVRKAPAGFIRSRCLKAASGDAIRRPRGQFSSLPDRWRVRSTPPGGGGHHLSLELIDGWRQAGETGPTSQGTMTPDVSQRVPYLRGARCLT